MLAPLVVVLIVTVTEPAKVLRGGLKVGGAPVCEMVYVALLPLLLAIPLAAAIALSVVVVVSGTGPVLFFDGFGGLRPLLFFPTRPPPVLVLSVPATEPAKVPPAGLKVGGAAGCTIVYVALVTLLLVIPLAAAIALSVVVVVSGTGPV